MLSSITWIDPNLPIWYKISKIPKFNIDYNFHHRILLADPIGNIFSSYWSQILRTSETYRNLNETRTKHRRTNKLLIKRWNFSRMSILKPQNSISWAGVITNKIMLWNEIKAKIRLNLTSIKPILLCLQTHGEVM